MASAVSSAGAPAAACSSSAARKLGQGALERDIAHRRRLQDRVKSGSSASAARRAPASRRSSGSRAGQAASAWRMASASGGSSAPSVATIGAERVEQLRHQHQRARELRRCLAELALRLQHDGEIVDGLGIVRLELDQPPVGARGIVEPLLLLRLLRFGKQLLGRIAAAAGAGGRRLLVRGAALFAVHARLWSGRSFRRRCRRFLPAKQPARRHSGASV